MIMMIVKHYYKKHVVVLLYHKVENNHIYLVQNKDIKN